MSTSPDQNGNGPSASPRYISREALKQFERLSPSNQCLVANAIAQPPPPNRWELVENLKKHRVRHFRASESLRISVCPYRDRDVCVIHIGTHSEFDHFAAHYDGSPVHNPIPLEETDIMAKFQHVPTGDAPQPLAGRIREVGELVQEGLGEVIKAVQQELYCQIDVEMWRPTQEALEKLADEFGEARKKAENEIAQLRGDLHKENSQLTQRVQQLETASKNLSAELRGLQTDIEQVRTNAKDQMTQATAELQEQFKTGMAELATSQAADRRVASQQWQSADQRLADAERRTEAIQADLGQLERRMQSFEEQSHQAIRQFSDALASVQSEQAAATQWRRQSDDQLAGLLQTLAELGKQVNGLAVDLAQTITRHERIQEDLAQLVRRVDELTAAGQRGLLCRLRKWVAVLRERLRKGPMRDAFQGSSTLNGSAGPQ